MVLCKRVMILWFFDILCVDFFLRYEVISEGGLNFFDWLIRYFGDSYKFL